MDDHIIPECFIDTILMEILLPTKVGYNHQKGCNQVTKAMQSKKLIDDFAVGILDNDKKPPIYIKEFRLLTTRHKVQLHKHQSRCHYLILHENIEQWLLDECQQANLLLETYNIPSDIEELKKQTKKTTNKNDNRFKSLFRALKKNNAKGIIQLFEWTDYLINNPYDADEKILINKGNLS